MYKLLLFFIVVFCYCPHAFAQTGSTDSIILNEPRTDTEDDGNNDAAPDTTLHFRAFSLSADSVHAWRQQKGYAWIKNIDSLLKENDNGRDSGSRSYSEEHTSSFWGNIFASGFLTALFWVIAGGLLLFIIYKLFLSKGLFGVSASKKNAAENDEEETGQDIDGKDFNSLLNAAYNAGDYRFATRWLFLLTLQRLNEREMIRFGSDKTNREYMNELPPAKRNDFAVLSLYYEYAWYGKVSLQKETFDMIRAKYNDFLNRL